MNQDRKQKIFLWGVIAAAAVTILPLLMLSVYDHPSADDFAYAEATHAVWKSTGNLFLVIKEAVRTSMSYWNRWQGLYTSAFLLALEPGIFGEQYYGITGFLTIGTILIANLTFCWYVLHRRLHASGLTASAFGMLLSFLMLQFMPSGVEGLYWYNGAMNYTFFYGVLMLLFCMVLELCQEQKKTAAAAGKCLVGMLLAAALSGGNHVTAFTGLLLTAAVWGSNLLTKNKQGGMRVGMVFAVETAGFLLNVLSPGTRVRSGAFEEPKGVFRTVWNALLYLLERINGWIGLAMIVCVVLMLPVIFDCVKKIRSEQGFQFRCPLLVFAGSVGLLTAMCCPSYYAMGAIGAGRLVNIIYFAFVVLVFGNVFYVCGWLSERFAERSFEWSGSWILTVVLLTFGMLAGCWRSMAGTLAWNSLRSGEALAYSMEADARYNLYLNSKGQDVEVPSFSFYPQLLYYEDLTEDPDDWRNLQVEEYYGLNSVVRK